MSLFMQNYETVGVEDRYAITNTPLRGEAQNDDVPGCPRFLSVCCFRVVMRVIIA